MEGADKLSTLTRLSPPLAQDLIKEADCSSRREDVGGPLRAFNSSSVRLGSP